MFFKQTQQQPRPGFTSVLKDDGRQKLVVRDARTFESSDASSSHPNLRYELVGPDDVRVVLSVILN